MKRCQKCDARYLDNTLEFCLEDGTRLSAHVETATATPARAEPLASRMPEPTMVMGGFQGVPDTMESASSEIETVTGKKNSILPSTGSQSKVLETAPIVLALAHNWWQWLYLENQYSSSITSYIFSANFLMWLLLLGAGVGMSLWSVKQSDRKTFAYVGLVILAINLILFLVPRR